MILRNGRCILSTETRDGLEVVIRQGQIGEIREGRNGHPGPEGRERKSDSTEEIVDLGGNYLAPGFIDLHVHGGLGRDTMEASPDAFREICRYHASGGTTSLLLTSATAPLNKITDALEAVRTCRSSIEQIAGVHVEGPFISRHRPGAQSNEFILNPAPEHFGPLLKYQDIIKRMTLAPEVPGALELIDELRKVHISVSGGHSDAWDDQARAAFEHGMRSVTHTFNCMSSARRDGIYRTAGLLEFALSEPGISCELIADGHHVSTTLMKLLYRAKGCGGICLVTDATAGAGLADGARFSLFGRDCIVKHGVCVLADRSALAGSAARMIDLVRTMVKEIGLPLHEAVKMATENPARQIGLKSKGRLEKGADADFAVLSPALEVVRTFVAGREIFSL
ncbi:MAG: N-acetylglucosamine-6-phosphate deacetylase [Spartobacteria bacterium]|nr:N-acetylglucosamine-6-phosphate deacetylase [Spartobacteria bacterium]